MNEQKAQRYVWDKALSHIREQEKLSYKVVEDGAYYGFSCEYRHHEGIGCAFAPFIKEYHPSMESRNALFLINHRSESIDPLAIMAGDFFCDQVQYCHDSSAREQHDDKLSDEEGVKLFVEKMELIKPKI